MERQRPFGRAAWERLLLALLVVSACTDPGSREGFGELTLTADRFQWSDPRHPPSDFETELDRCRGRIDDDAWTRGLPAFNRGIRLVGCLEKQGWSRREEIFRRKQGNGPWAEGAAS